jgi:hypothetical protein
MTTAITPPRKAIHSGIDGGRHKASSIPVIAALAALETGLPMIFWHAISESFAPAMHKTIAKKAFSPKKPIPEAAAGIHAMNTSFMACPVV